MPQLLTLRLLDETKGFMYFMISPSNTPWSPGYFSTSQSQQQRAYLEQASIFDQFTEQTPTGKLFILYTLKV